MEGVVPIEQLLAAAGVPTALLVYLIMRFRLLEEKMSSFRDRIEDRFETQSERIETLERFTGLDGVKLYRRHDDPPPTGDEKDADADSS